MSSQHLEEKEYLNRCLYWMMQGYPEEDASSKAMIMFQKATTRSAPLMASSYEPSQEEVAKVVSELQCNARAMKVEHSEDFNDLLRQVDRIQSSAMKANTLASKASEDLQKVEADLNSLRDEKSKAQSSSKPANGILGKINFYTVAKICLYVLIVPITAKTIDSAISHIGLDTTFTATISWILAIITDFVALEHFSKAKNPIKSNQDAINLSIACAILSANMAGAFLLFQKEMKIEEKATASLAAEELKSSLMELKLKAALAEGEYLAAKWPKAIDPKGCELGTVSECGPHFGSTTIKQKSRYEAAKTLLAEARKDLAAISKAPAQKSDFWWHFSYYIFIWLLLFSVIRLEGLKQREKEVNST